ncbi:hypothetical protein ACFLWY_02970 [Chloroflexota bacterium]
MRVAGVKAASAGEKTLIRARSTGDGIRMGMEVGAELLNMDAAEIYTVGYAKRASRTSGVSLLGTGHSLQTVIYSYYVIIIIKQTDLEDRLKTLNSTHLFIHN